MKLSCNGCRILRKGCSENCIIRPCLEWINSPESQANATLFLAKFYGRTALLNLITAAPQHLAPVVFRSLLYEACGRLVNPSYGSLGLFWSGEWEQCEAAVHAVLTGSKINGVTPTPSSSDHVHVLSTCDIRHMPKRINNVDDMIRGFKKVGQVIKPSGSMLWNPILQSQSHLNLPASQTDLDLELTLSFRCQSTYGNKTHF